MATLLLSAVGGALGGAVGGGIAGIGAAALGRAAGAMAGAMIDQQLLGRGGRAVETPRLEALRLLGAREGAPIAQVFGRAKVAGTVIWASRFRSVSRTRTVGSKGARTRISDTLYTVSLAVGLCVGPIVRVGRIWADGAVVDLRDVTLRVHRGDEAQEADPVILAIEGEADAPCYRGLAYVVFEDLDLSPYGDRIPQFAFEVFREPDVSRGTGGFPPLPGALIEGVALSPGSGEFALSTAIVRRRLDPGVSAAENVNAVDGRPDLLVALDQLEAELPACRSVSLVVSWFGDDLRCGRCRIAPAVEVKDKRTEGGTWRVGDVGREAARVVGRTTEARPVFGGTPSDESVEQAIAELRRRGMKMMFYPFVLMDVPPGNGLPDPHGGTEQAAFPWRGRITLEIAPGRPGSADMTAAAEAEVRAFFGAAQIGDFVVDEGGVRYVGPPEDSFRRFVLHYAHLCARAGGVDAFCIGSELRGLTTIRSSRTSYPAGAALRVLAADVRRILGPATRLTYAADWSEYFGHHPDDGSGDVLFHLDPLWADPAIDAVGIDNYMPLTDWRNGVNHLDAQEAGAIYDLDYLRSRIEGGEGFDWFYATPQDRAAQRRTPIVDSGYGEDWVFRCKDIRSWWSQPHFDRIDGVREGAPTAWIPASKPIWFTEIGCAAIDKGTNQPNLFLDPKSSESALPAFSDGTRDEHLQRRFLQATLGYWREKPSNPVSPVYGGPMVDTAASHVWTWDARPWPAFPGRLDVWGDGDNHRCGHWISGRLGAADLAETVAEICASAGVEKVDVTGLEGVVTGYCFESGVTARQALQPLMLAYGFDAAECGGEVRFRMRASARAAEIAPEALVAAEADGRPESPVRYIRATSLDAPAAVRLGYARGESDYEPAAVEARSADGAFARIEAHETSLTLGDAEAESIARRWLREAQATRESVSFALPPSLVRFEVGDCVSLDGGVLRLDRTIGGERRETEAVRQASARSAPRVSALQAVSLVGPRIREPMAVVVADIPAPFAVDEARDPLVAVFSDPWPGGASVHVSADGFGWRLAAIAPRPATMGMLQSPLAAAATDRWWRGDVSVRLYGGALDAAPATEVLGGANLAALRDPGTGRWEVVQFASAELTGPRTYRLGGLLRGQAGTQARALPAGAAFLVLDDAPIRLPVGAGGRGTVLRLRVGPSGARLDDPCMEETEASLETIGASPLAPVMRRPRRSLSGWSVDWVRRSRLDADVWLQGEPPFVDVAPVFEVEVRKSGLVVRRASATIGAFTYYRTQAAADGVAPPFEICVREVSARDGVSAEAGVLIDG